MSTNDAATAATRMDPNQDKLAHVHPALRLRVVGMLNALEESGLQIRVTSGLRTYEEQQKLYDQGRKSAGEIVTNAQPGMSWHNFGLAVDLVPMWVQNGPTPDVVTYRQAHGITLDWNPAHADWQKMLSCGAAFKLSEGATWRTFKDFPHFYPEELPANPPNVVRALYSTGVAQDPARSVQAGIDAVSEWFEKLLG